MKILDDLLSVLDMKTSVRDIRMGLFHTAVLTRNCGLASTLSQDALRQHQEGEPLVKEPGYLLNKRVDDLARMAYSESLLEAAIGMATINSLLEVDESLCINRNAADLIAEKGKGKKIAIVGHFPFIPKLQGLAEKVWVIEKNPQEGDLSEEQVETYIPQAEVVGITGTAITNHTIEHLLELCHPRAYVVVLGDTVPLTPVLFNYGIDAISGTRVVDAELALRCISEGATYRQIRGILKLIMLNDKSGDYEQEEVRKMPNKDGMGPTGKGPLTGRCSGHCAIPLNTTDEELSFLNNQKKVLRDHLGQIETRIALLQAPSREEKRYEDSGIGNR
jgi:uncharacterized protein